jgi:hypothetical protein
MAVIRLIALSALLGACPAADPEPTADAGSEQGDVGRPVADAGERHALFDAGPPPPVGAITGRIVDVDGAPLADLEVQCCTSDTCYVGSTDDDGQYRFGQLLLIPRKFRVISELGDTIDGLFYQDVIADVTTDLGRDAILQPLPETSTNWTGGTVLLAGGALQMTAPEGALHFETAEPSPVGARAIAPADLPPFDREPWRVAGSEAMAFVITPFHLTSAAPVDVRVLDGVSAVPGTRFAVWSVDADDATATEVGTATVDPDGALVTDPGHSLKNLSVIVFLRQD